MESLRRPEDSKDASQTDALTRAKESPRSWEKPTNRNYWAKLDPQDFARFPAVKPLPYLEESRLFEQAQNGDIEARNTLWKQHLRLAFSVVNKFYIPQSLLADAIQEAVLGLAVAIQRFQVHRYNAFSTYAWHWMEQRVRMFRINHLYGARLPAYLFQSYGRFRKGLRRCRSRADWFDWRDEWLSSAPDMFDRLSRFHSIAIAEFFEDQRVSANEIDDQCLLIEQEETRSIMNQAVACLPDRERHIIKRRFGLDGESDATLQEIGDEIGVTRERVRQVEMEIMDTLRRDLEKRSAGLNGKC